MRENILKKTVTFGLSALAAAALMLVSGEAKAASDQVYRTLDEIKESGTINIGVFSDKNPFGYVDENGEYQGYDVYFAQRIGQDLGVEVNYVSTEAANRVEYLETGKVDIILANFTVTEERAEKVDFALPYMNVALGVVSPESRVITDLAELTAEDPVIVISGTTAETYLIENHPEITLQKYDTYANAKNALENGNGVAWANDNTEVIAYANQYPGFVVGIPTLGSEDTIAPAVTKGNETLLTWINDEITSLADEQFFHADYEATLLETYGEEFEDQLVIEGGVVATDETAVDETALEESAGETTEEETTVKATEKETKKETKAEKKKAKKETKAQKKKETKAEKKKETKKEKAKEETKKEKKETKEEKKETKEEKKKEEKKEKKKKKKVVSKKKYMDCDGSGHGYWEIKYDDGSVVIKKF